MFRNQNYFGRFRIKLLGQAWEKIIVSIKRTTSFKQSELAVFLSKDINPGHIVDSPINKSRSHCQPHLDVDSLGLWIVFLSPAPLLALHLHRRRSSRHTHMLIYTWSAGPPNPVMKFRSKTCSVNMIWHVLYECQYTYMSEHIRGLQKCWLPTFDPGHSAGYPVYLGDMVTLTWVY